MHDGSNIKTSGAVREFPLQKGIRPLMILSGLVLAGLAIGSPVVMVINAKEGISLGRTLMAGAIPLFLFGPLSLWCWKIYGQLPYMKLCLDEDGIWYAHGGEASRVPWGCIVGIKERSFLRCLDLLDESGEKLVRAEYELQDFSALREIFLEKVQANLSRSRLKDRFSKSRWHHVWHALGLLFLAGLAALLFLASIKGLFWAVLLVMALVVWEYATTIYAFRITSGGLVFFYPFRQKRIPFSEVTSVTIDDRLVNGHRVPEVSLSLSSRKKPVRLQKLGADTTEMVLMLKTAIKLHS